MITKQHLDQAYTDLKSHLGGIPEDYFWLLYLEGEHGVPRAKALNQIALGGNDYGIDAFHFDENRRVLYLFQFKFLKGIQGFKTSMQRLAESGLERIFAMPNRDEDKNEVLVQLRAALVENRELINQVSIRFVFMGDPGVAERSQVLDKLREDIENKKHYIDQFFGDRSVDLVVEFRSSTAGSAAIASTDRMPSSRPPSRD